jgi:hypothetical protein
MSLFRASLLIVLTNILAGAFGWWQLYLIRHVPENERLMIDLPYVLFVSGGILQIILCAAIFLAGFGYWLLTKNQKEPLGQYNLRQSIIYAALCGLPIFFVTIVVFILFFYRSFL